MSARAPPRLHRVLVLLLCVATISIAAASGAKPASPAPFVLAIHIAVTREDLHLLPRFLERTYHPDNLYLVDLPAAVPPSPSHLPRVAAGAANVHMRAAETSVPGGVSEVVATLSAMAFFLDWVESTATSFHYFLNTSPREYPLTTPQNTRDLLAWVHGTDILAPNFLLISPRAQWQDYEDNYNRLSYDPSIAFSDNASALAALIPSLYSHPDRNRRTYTIARSDTALIVSSEFVRLATDSMLSRRLLMLFADSKHSVSHFFATLALESGITVGKWVDSTSLRCADVTASLLRIERRQAAGLPDPLVPAPAEALDQQPAPAQPCIFTGPIQLGGFDSSASMALRDAIDTVVLSRQGPLNTSRQGRLLETTVRLIEMEVLRVVRGYVDPDEKELSRLQPVPL
jgi:Core-2/I-Branching enzyme